MQKYLIRLCGAYYANINCSQCLCTPINCAGLIDAGVLRTVKLQKLQHNISQLKCT